MGSVNWPRVRDILISTICIGIILWACWSILGQFVDAIIILLLSMAVAFLVSPVADFLVRRNLPRLWASLLAYVVVLGLLFFLGYELIFTLIGQITNFSNTIQGFFNNLPTMASNFRAFLVSQGIPQANIDRAIGEVQTQAVSIAQDTARNALDIVFIMTNAFLNIMLVVVLSFYLTLDGKRIRDSLVSIMPKGWLSNALLFEDALNRVVGNYIRGQLTLASFIGVMAGVVCLFSGPLASYALIVGALGFLFETIPMVGPALASIPAILLSLVLPDPYPRTLWVIVAFIVIQIIESNILGPRVVGRAVGLHPVAAILALLVGAKLFGVFGALIATPLVAAIWVVISSAYRSLHGETPDQMLARKRAPWTLRRPGRTARGDHSSKDGPLADAPNEQTHTHTPAPEVAAETSHATDTV